MKKTLWFAALLLIAAGLAFGGTITVTQPAGGSFALGAACPVHWTTTGAVGNVKIQLIRPGGGLVDPLANRLDPGSSPYPWVVASPAVVGESYRIRVVTTDGTTQGESEVFTVTAPGDPGDPGTPGTISNVRLGGASPYTLGNSIAVSWTATGVSQQLKLQLVRSGGALVGPIVNTLAPGTTSYLWPAGEYIGGTAQAGEEYSYKVRVSTIDNALMAESAVFKLKAAGSGITEFTLVDLSALQVQRDLEMLSIRYVFNRGGWIVARVKNHISAIDQDVRFSLVFPEAVRDGAQLLTRRLTLAAGAEDDVYLYSLPQASVPLRGLLARVTVDGPSSQITETNEGNNTREARIAILDFSCSTDGLHLYNLILDQDSDYRVKFQIHVRHNFPRAIHNVRVYWKVVRVSSGEVLRSIEQTIAAVEPGEAGYTWEVNETYKAISANNSGGPKMGRGITYRVIARILDLDDAFEDVNPSNDSASFTFSIPRA